MPWSGIISELFLNTEYSDTDIRTCICLTKNYILTYCFQMFAYRETVLEEAHRGMELREHCRHIVDNDDRHYRFHSLCVHQGIGVSSRTTPFPFPSFSAHTQTADSLSFAFLLSAYVDLAMRFSWYFFTPFFPLSCEIVLQFCAKAFHGIFSLPFSRHFFNVSGFKVSLWLLFFSQHKGKQRLYVANKYSLQTF